MKRTFLYIVITILIASAAFFLPFVIQGAMAEDSMTFNTLLCIMNGVSASIFLVSVVIMAGGYKAIGSMKGKGLVSLFLKLVIIAGPFILGGYLGFLEYNVIADEHIEFYPGYWRLPKNNDYASLPLIFGFVATTVAAWIALLARKGGKKEKLPKMTGILPDLDKVKCPKVVEDVLDYSEDPFEEDEHIIYTRIIPTLAQLLLIECGHDALEKPEVVSSYVEFAGEKLREAGISFGFEGSIIPETLHRVADMEDRGSLRQTLEEFFRTTYDDPHETFLMVLDIVVDKLLFYTNRNALEIVIQLCTSLGGTEGQVLDIYANDGFESFVQKYLEARSQDPVKLHLSTLGLDPGASRDDVKSAFKRLSKQYHPDTLKANGKSEEEIQTATELFISIKEAYDFLMENL